MIELERVDKGKAFDFGKTSDMYGKYRDIYPTMLFDRLRELGVGKNGEKWLDIGTGTGVLPRAMASFGADITATDISENQIEKAKELSADYPNIHYFAAPAEKCPVEDDSMDAVTACQCFWYFAPEKIVPEIKRVLKNNGVFVKIYMGWSPDDPVSNKSQAMIKELNPDWNSGAAAEADLKLHYFDNLVSEFYNVDIPFTRSSWHGRMMASRGVLGSMKAESIPVFEARHKEMLEKLPEEFTIKHELYITSYKIVK